MTEERRALLPATYRPMVRVAGPGQGRPHSRRPAPHLPAPRRSHRSVAALTRSHFNLKKGDRAVIVAGNCLEYIEIVDGLSEAGVAAATCNPHQTPAEIGFILNDCSARVAFVAPETEPIVRAADCPT
jgi:hypothetical protein